MVPYAKPLHATIYQINARATRCGRFSRSSRIWACSTSNPTRVRHRDGAGVERFQEIFGLRRDGIVGHETMVLVRSIREGML